MQIAQTRLISIETLVLINFWLGLLGLLTATCYNIRIIIFKKEIIIIKKMMIFNVFEWIIHLVWNKILIILSISTFALNLINFRKNQKDKEANLKEKIRERIREKKHTTIECFKEFCKKVDDANPDSYQFIEFQSRVLHLRFLAIDSSCELLDIITKKLSNNRKKIFKKNKKLLLSQLLNSNVEFREETKKYKQEVEKYKKEIENHFKKMELLEDRFLNEQLLKIPPLFDNLFQISSKTFHFTVILDETITTMDNIIKKEFFDDLAEEIFSSFKVIKKTLSFKER